MILLKSISKVTSEDLAGVYKEVAETVGVDNAYKIYSHFKGLQLMFPLKFYSREYIVQQICSWVWWEKCTCSGKKIWVFRKQGEADIEGAGETGNNKKRHDRRKGGNSSWNELWEKNEISVKWNNAAYNMSIK